MDLAKMFMPSKSGQVNPFHENVQKSSTPNVAHGSLPQSTPTSGPFHDYGLPPPYFYPPYDMSTPHSQSLHMTAPPDSHVERLTLISTVYLLFLKAKGVKN